MPEDGVRWITVLADRAPRHMTERDESDQQGEPDESRPDESRPDETVERIAAAIVTLEAIVEDRAVLADVDPALRERLVRAAGMVSRPDRAALRKMAKALRRKDRDTRRRADEQVLDATGIRALRRAPVFPTPPPLTGGEARSLSLPHADADRDVRDDGAEAPRDLREPRKCYVCKAPFQRVHPFYDQMCEPCAALNWEKRHQSADLSGRVAIVTGARVKIGFHAAIKLLRAGAYVVVTTRFPRDAASRFAREEDFEQWSDRLEVHGLDLRHTPSVEQFCQHALRSLPRLDFLINNACQTVRRPPGFYRHLMDAERAPLDALDARTRPLLAATEQRATDVSSAALSQLALLPGDTSADLHLFPSGALDADLQQVDLRDRNSWRLTLAEVPSVELLEVHLVNAVAPFVLNARLKPLMLRVPTRDKHIVNVSAMEGQFYRDHKTDKHPHTNMAKAALNMMTRTSAADYVRDGIHMNSVDTGWITDEDPLDVAARKVAEHGFHPPLDVVDGAARIVDPIFRGLAGGEHLWGLFLKDYHPIPW
jgi:NAD(P)-dependent dehydrogenase (short-subunit alcohol dehydrogenase family)